MIEYEKSHLDWKPNSTVCKHLCLHVFPIAGLLTGLHFTATSVLSWTLVTSGQEERNDLEWSRIIVLATVTCFSIWFSNLSLFLNSVGFYQIAKLSVIPCTLLLQWILYQIKVSDKTKLSLAILTLGIGIATITQVDLLLLGLVVAAFAVATTSLQQIVYSEMMKDKKLSGTQLYYNIGPLSAIIMLVAGTLIDQAANQNVSFVEFPFTPDQLVTPPPKSVAFSVPACAHPLSPFLTCSSGLVSPVSWPPP